MCVCMRDNITENMYGGGLCFVKVKEIWLCSVAGGTNF